MCLVIEVVKMYTTGQNEVSMDDKLLNYASHLIIKEYESLKDEKPNGVFFNKIMSLLNKNIDSFKLSHYWYRYGDQVCRQKMPTNLEWTNVELNETKVDWKYDTPEFFKELEGHPIEEEIKSLVREYNDNFEDLIDDVYSYAPYDFQRRFLELRKLFYGANNAYNWDMESYKELSKPILEDTYDSFPIHDFKEIEQEYELVRTFMEAKLDSEDWKFKILEKISTNFWFLFCYHLRMNPKARENIPPDILHHWEESLSMDADRHRKSIADTIIKSIERDSSLLEYESINEFYKWRKEDKKETEKIIDEFVDNYTAHSTA